MVEVELVLS